MEQCKNPWSNECKNSDIKLYLLFKGERRSICKKCWNKMAERD